MASMISADSPRWAPSDSACAAFRSYSQRPARSTPKSPKASSMTSSNSRATSRRPLTLAAIRPSASALVGPAGIVSRGRAASRRRPVRSGLESRVVPGRGPSAAERPQSGLGQAEAVHGAGRSLNGRDLVPFGAMAHWYQPGRGPRSAVAGRGAVRKRARAARRPTRERRPRSPGRPPMPTPLRTPTTRPAPAARAIARSAGVSPTTATRDGSVANAWQTARTGSGAGFIANPSSPQTIASTAARMPSARSVASVGARSSVVTTAIRRPAGPQAIEQDRQVGQGHGEGDRIRARTRRSPSRVARRPRWDTSAAGRSRPSLDLGHRGERQRPARRDTRRSTDRNRSSRTRRRRPAGASRLRGGSPRSRAQPPHIAWKSMSVPSLSKMTSVDPGQVGGARRSWDAAGRPRLQHRLRGGQRVASVGDFVTAEDQAGLRRELSTTGAPAGGTARFGSLNVSTKTGSRPARRVVRTRTIEPRKRRPRRCPAGGSCRSRRRSG